MTETTPNTKAGYDKIVGLNAERIVKSQESIVFDIKPNMVLLYKVATKAWEIIPIDASAHELDFSVGNILHIGSSEMFSRMRFAVSTLADAGLDGVWEYMSGKDGWTLLSTLSGFTNVTVPFEADPVHTTFDEHPLDWQKANVHGSTMFWIRFRVTAGATINPEVQFNEATYDWSIAQYSTTLNAPVAPGYEDFHCRNSSAKVYYSGSFLDIIKSLNADNGRLILADSHDSSSYTPLPDSLKAYYEFNNRGTPSNVTGLNAKAYKFRQTGLIKSSSPRYNRGIVDLIGLGIPTFHDRQETVEDAGVSIDTDVYGYENVSKLLYYAIGDKAFTLSNDLAIGLEDNEIKSSDSGELAINDFVILFNPSTMSSEMHKVQYIQGEVVGFTADITGAYTSSTLLFRVRPSQRETFSIFSEINNKLENELNVYIGSKVDQLVVNMTVGSAMNMSFDAMSKHLIKSTVRTIDEHIALEIPPVEGILRGNVDYLVCGGNNIKIGYADQGIVEANYVKSVRLTFNNNLDSVIGAEEGNDGTTRYFKNLNLLEGLLNLDVELTMFENELLHRDAIRAAEKVNAVLIPTATITFLFIGLKWDGDLPTEAEGGTGDFTLKGKAQAVLWTDSGKALFGL